MKDPNSYSYVMNNPVILIDPLGLEKQEAGLNAPSGMNDTGNAESTQAEIATGSDPTSQKAKWGERGSEQWIAGYEPGMASKKLHDKWISQAPKNPKDGIKAIEIVTVNGVSREVYGASCKEELDMIIKSMSLMDKDDLKRIPRIVIKDKHPGIKTGGASIKMEDPTKESIVILRNNFYNSAKVIYSEKAGGNVLGTFFHEAGHFLNYNKRLPSATEGTSMLNWWKQYKYCPKCVTKGPNEAPAEFYRKLMTGGGKIDSNFQKWNIPKPQIINNLMKEVNQHRTKIGAKQF